VHWCGVCCTSLSPRDTLGGSGHRWPCSRACSEQWMSVMCHIGHALAENMWHTYVDRCSLIAGIEASCSARTTWIMCSTAAWYTGRMYAGGGVRVRRSCLPHSFLPLNTCSSDACTYSAKFPYLQGNATLRKQATATRTAAASWWYP
jgi:hypothetical protein